MKKLLALFMSISVSLFAFVGCGTESELKKDEPKSKKSLKSSYEEKALAKTFSEADGITYVMIYNPNIYDENSSYNKTLNTGDFGDHVEAVINRGDGLGIVDRPIVETPTSFATLQGIPLDKFDLSGGRSGGFAIPYQVGDTHDFYCGAENRTLETFECVYAGEHCNIWTYNVSVDADDIEKYGEEFDKNIYPASYEMFGEPRFVDTGRKVELLVYPMSQRGLCGFYYFLDTFSTEEASPEVAKDYRINTDHAIININSFLLNSEETMYSTIAHELQHLICGSKTFENAEMTLMRTWLNEAMSGFAEETLYPGSKESLGHFEAFSTSTRIRHGQSLYNFDNTTTYSEFDIGVYGSVYLFSEYLVSISGDDTFSKIHSYWGNPRKKTLNEADAIANSVPKSVYDEIDKSIDFGNTIKIDDENELWLSKLTLNFYLSLLKYDKNDPEAYEKVVSQTLLYDEINPADIEGGGRVIVALKDGKFEIPKDADNGFVYVGLDKNFDIVTEFIIQ